MRSSKKPNEFDILPVCVLRDDFEKGSRTSRFKLNDVFRPAARTLIKPVYNLLKSNFESTKIFGVLPSEYMNLKKEIK